MNGAKGTEHYFTAQPAGEFTTSLIQVEVAGLTVDVETAGGIFSPGHLDEGTAALLRTVPTPPAEGTFLDIGCGWGPLALTMALESPAARVTAIDVNERALELTRRNAARLDALQVHACLPDEVPADRSFDLMWSNPPIRVGKAELHTIMNAWLPRLTVGGHAWLVVAKHLGADSFEKWLRETFAATHETVREDTHKGFRILSVTRTR